MLQQRGHRLMKSVHAPPACTITSLLALWCADWSCTCRPRGARVLVWQGWVAKQVGSVCEASGSYMGPCSLELFVGELTPEEKAQMEARLGLCRQPFLILSWLALCQVLDLLALQPHW